MVYIYHDSRSEVAKYAITYEGECRSTWPTEIWTNWQAVRGRGRRGGGGGVAKCGNITYVCFAIVVAVVVGVVAAAGAAALGDAIALGQCLQFHVAI